jgi:hypothetical protein
VKKSKGIDREILPFIEGFIVFPKEQYKMLKSPYTSHKKNT